jgi:phosphate transport system substrate-binding protein
MRILHSCYIALVILTLSGCNSAGTAPAPGTPSASSEYIENRGSDTLVNLALAWAEKYQEIHPDVRISVTGGGSGTGIAALINGTVDIANASRSISAEELATARSNNIEPVEFTVARDAIGIIVNPRNPVDRLTIQQISDIYSGKISNWMEVGGEDRPIVRLSRETNSGTHVYFLEEVLRQGRDDDPTLFSTDTLLLPSSEGITAEVRENPNSIGYEGLGYITHDVKVLAVASQEGELEEEDYVLPSADSVNNGIYPIARDLYMYTVGQPAGIVKEYLDWILSPEAQQIVDDIGFVPIVPEQIYNPGIQSALVRK